MIDNGVDCKPHIKEKCITKSQPMKLDGQDATGIVRTNVQTEDITGHIDPRKYGAMTPTL